MAPTLLLMPWLSLGVSESLLLSFLSLFSTPHSTSYQGLGWYLLSESGSRTEAPLGDHMLTLETGLLLFQTSGLGFLTLSRGDISAWFLDLSYLHGSLKNPPFPVIRPPDFAVLCWTRHVSPLHPAVPQDSSPELLKLRVSDESHRCALCPSTQPFSPSLLVAIHAAPATITKYHRLRGINNKGPTSKYHHTGGQVFNMNLGDIVCNIHPILLDRVKPWYHRHSSLLLCRGTRPACHTQSFPG